MIPAILVAALGGLVLAAPESLGCEDTVRAALEHGRGLRAARDAVARAERERGTPPGALEVRVRDDLRAPWGGAARAGVRYTLPAFGASGAHEAAAEAEIRLVAAENLLLEAEIAAAVRRDHLAVRGAREALAHAREQSRLRRAALEAATRRVEAGTTTLLVKARARLKLATATSKAQAAEAALAAAERRAATWTRLPPGDAPCVPDTALKDPGDAALEAQPGVLAAEEAITRVEARGDAKVLESWPWPFLELTWDREAGGPDRLLLQIGAPIPLPGTSVAAVEAARLVRGRADLTRRRTQVHRAVVDARAELEAATAALAALTSTEEAATEARQVAEEAKAAQASVDETLAVQQTLLDWSRDMASARERVERARIELRRREGRR